MATTQVLHGPQHRLGPQSALSFVLDADNALFPDAVKDCRRWPMASNPLTAGASFASVEAEPALG